MTLTNYWWQIIWLFAVGGFLAVFSRKQQELVMGKPEWRWSKSAAWILALPYVIWATFRPDIFGDTAVYRKMFIDMPEKMSELSGYLSVNSKDQGFSVAVVFLKSIVGNSDIILFFIFAFIQMACLVYVFRKYSTNYWISMFLFVVSTDYLSWMHNGTRQFVAATIIFACFELIVKKKYVPMIIIILLCSTIHGSALIMIPIIFIIQGRAWNKKTILFILCVGIAIVYVEQLTPILDNLLSETQYSDMITNEIWTNDDGTNILRILVYSVPALLSLIGKKYVDKANDPLINICVNASAVTMILYCLAGVSSGIYIGRLPIYTTLMGYIAVPWLIDNMFTKNSARIVKMMMVAAYLIFFYFQLHFGWGLI